MGAGCTAVFLESDRHTGPPPRSHDICLSTDTAIRHGEGHIHAHGGADDRNRQGGTSPSKPRPLSITHVDQPASIMRRTAWNRGSSEEGARFSEPRNGRQIMGSA